MTNSDTDFTSIWKFIQQCELFTLATSCHNQPYCTPCFYAFDEMDQLLVFKSNMETRHAKELLENPLVAGSILPQKLGIGQVKGLQFTGRNALVKNCTDPLKLQELYYRKFPIARTMKGELWVISLEMAKLTDSKLGFGKKLNWLRVKTGRPEPYR
jgi:uncharacterized protein YhbP (UPF0306 family)